MTVQTSEVGVRRRVEPRLLRIATAIRDTSIGYGHWLGAEVRAAVPGRLAPAATERPHALVIATSLPPRFDGGVFRPLSWLRYASENGWRISALTRAAAGDETDGGRQLAATIPDDVAIHEAKPLDLEPSQRLFFQVDGGFLTALAMYRAGLEAFAGAPPSVVVATGPRFSSFIAGYLLARRFGSQLVLDYRDEWSENPFGFVQQGRDDRWWERRCLKAADAVLFTTDGQLAHARARFPGLLDGKGGVLLNGWEPDPRVEAAETESRDDGLLIIAFSGVLGTMALPGAFLEDLAGALEIDPRLKHRVRLRFIGRRLPPAERELERFPHPEMLELIDQCPRADADRLVRQSDILLLLSNADMARYLPGKVFEYLATGRPILVHGHPGEAPTLVDRLGAGLHVEAGDENGLADALGALSRASASDWNTEHRRAWAHDHTRRRMARAFFDRLAELVAEGGTEARPR
ncbi:glycosyltransferase [Thalassobaculum sp.]|uniref:glycosyltransferase n=1 Tax=Thalassobaculum sp. TaxID=2022740 RepID=UPI0032EC6008